MSSAAMLVANEMESMVVKNLEGASDDVSAMLLVKMKEPAETYLGRKVNNAMMTVPAYSMIPSVRPPRRRNYRKARHDDIIDELTSSCDTYGLDKRAVGRQCTGLRHGTKQCGTTALMRACA